LRYIKSEQSSSGDIVEHVILVLTGKRKLYVFSPCYFITCVT